MRSFKIRVLFCASEVAPFARTGGLADVAGTLPLALGKLGVEVKIMMPRYRGLPGAPKKLSKNVSVYFVENEAYFNRATLYGNEHGDYLDNLKRFSFFCREALRLTKEMGFRPDIVHANDWQTALLPVILKTRFSHDPFFKKIKTLLTVHNLAYQGHFAHRLYPELALDESLFSVDGFEFYGKINLLKAGLLYADAISTVSPTYAKEIQTREYGFGLEGVIRKRSKDLSGILNGIDTEVWNPAKDKCIKKPFTPNRLKGKEACKADLQKTLGLPVDADVPVLGMVTRLAEQKGLDLLSEISDALFSKKVQFILLGEGDGAYHTTFKNVSKRHPKNTAIRLGFNAPQAHKIYAGSDFFLMPSYFEPCGLGQMISLRCGTLPIVRRTGGLADTVIDADEDPKTGNGFVFKERNPEAFLKGIERALLAFRDKERFSRLQKNGMKADFSWKKSAGEYKNLYKRVCGL